MSRLFVFLTVAFAFAANGQGTGSYQPRPEAILALTSGPDVIVTSSRDQIYTFRPVGVQPTRGLIIYPGALVDFRAYAPLARAIAKEGYVTAIVKMPLDMAFLGYKRALAVQFLNRDIRTWAISGHSLGGVAGCTYAKEFGPFIDGVALLASYPSSSDSLRFEPLRVVSIYGTLDGLTDSADISKSVRLLPKSTRFVPIEGGNHTQFGSYWDGQNPSFVQPGDNPATISPAEQQTRIVEAIAEFLDQL